MHHELEAKTACLELLESDSKINIEDTNIIAKFLYKYSLVGEEGLEPSRLLRPMDFKSIAYTNSATRPSG